MTGHLGKAGFAQRLNAAFDRMEIPAKQRGRFTAIAQLFSVSPVAARDWCEGNSYPSVDKLLLIMDTVRCGADWLLFGRGSPVVPGPVETHSSPLSGLADRPNRLSSTSPNPLAAPGPADTLQWLQVEGPDMEPTLERGEWVGMATLLDGRLTAGLIVLAGVAPWESHATTPNRVAGQANAGAAGLIRRCALALDGSLVLSCDHPRHADVRRCELVAPGVIQELGTSLQWRVLGRLVERRQRLG